MPAARIVVASFCFSSLCYAQQNYAAKINYAPPSQIVKCLQLARRAAR